MSCSIPVLHNGGVAQMVERSLSMREVRGSMPRASSTFFLANHSLNSKVIKIVLLTRLPLETASSHGLIRPYTIGNGHITLKIPVLVRSPKSSNVEPG